MRDFFTILKIALGYKIQTFLVILFNILFVIFNLLSLLLFIPFLRLIFSNVESKELVKPNDAMGFKEYYETWYNYEMHTFVAEEGKVQALAYICITILICFFFKNLFRYMAMFNLADIRTSVVRDLRGSIHQKILSLDMSFFSEERKGDLQVRVMNDMQEVEVSIIGTLELLFREPLAIFVTLTTLFYMSWELTLFSLILLPISAFLISRIGKSLKRTSRKAQDKLGSLGAALEETLGGIRIIKAFTAEEPVDAHFSKTNSEYKRVIRRAYRKRDLASPLNEFMGACVMVALVFFGGKIVLQEGTMTGEAFIGFIIVFSQLLRPIQGVANSVSNINKGLASLDRIKKITESQITINDPENPAEFEGFKDKISYRKVSFVYPGTSEVVLSDIDIDIPKGSTFALVGESGGGKSTTADLLPRFFDCTKGGIFIDGVNIKDIKVRDLRGMMGIVTQQSILFNDTVRNNIALGKPEASDEEIVEAAKVANAHEFISALPNGYNTYIGDSGGKLSGGQRQRISIARAVLKNPDILILDEATSALDTESEKLVQDALDKIMRNRTALVIAHRLSTIQHADKILVIQKGEIVEQGKHEELYTKGGVYRRLCDLQSFS